MGNPSLPGGDLPIAVPWVCQVQRRLLCVRAKFIFRACLENHPHLLLERNQDHGGFLAAGELLSPYGVGATVLCGWG